MESCNCIARQSTQMNRLFYLFIAAAIVVTSVEGKAQSDFPAPALPSIPHKLFNIKDFGASADDRADNTVAIQSAIVAALAAGGGTVVVPAGIYLSGPLQMGSNLQLQIDSAATLKFLPIDRYPG